MKNNRKLSGYLINPEFQGKFLLIFGSLGIMQIAFFFYSLSALFDQIKFMGTQNNYDKELMVAQLNELHSNMIMVFGGSFLALTLFFLVISFRFTHKAAGALYHFQKSFDEMAQDKKLKELKLRDGDFFRDVEQSCNEMIKKL